MDTTTLPLWVVLASVAGALMIVAPIHPVAMTVLFTVCRHVGIAAASSTILRVAQTLPGIDLVTRTSSFITSLSARSNQDIAGKVLLKAQHGCIIFLSHQWAPQHSLHEPAKHLSDILLADNKWHPRRSFQEFQDQVNYIGLPQVYHHWFWQLWYFLWLGCSQRSAKPTRVSWITFITGSSIWISYWCMDSGYWISTLLSHSIPWQSLRCAPSLQLNCRTIWNPIAQILTNHCLLNSTLVICGLLLSWLQEDSMVFSYYQE